MNAFNTTGPSIFASDRAFTAQGKDGKSLSQSASDRYTGLRDPRSHMRKGGIQLPSDAQACSDKTAKILRGSPYNGNGK